MNADEPRFTYETIAFPLFPRYDESANTFASSTHLDCTPTIPTAFLPLTVGVSVTIDTYPFAGIDTCEVSTTLTSIPYSEFYFFQIWVPLMRNAIPLRPILIAKVEPPFGKWRLMVSDPVTASLAV